MVLGIVAVAGFFMVFITVLAAPLAWHLGATALRDMERHPGRWSGASSARAGLVLGIIGSGLLLFATLALMGLAAVVTAVANAPSAY